MPANVIYVNAYGEEVVLDDTEHIKTIGELYGRKGTEFPSLHLNEIKYGDGSTNIVSITLEPRNITLSFWMRQGKQKYREKLQEIKQVLLQTGQREGDWGQLKIRGNDGNFLCLNCVYTGGLNDVVRESWSWVKFDLKFRASDPYFYNGVEYSYTIQQNDRSGYLFFDNAILCNTQAEAIQITGEQTAGNLWWQVKINGATKYYAIVPDESIYMDHAMICDTQAEAINQTGESSPGNHWWQTAFEETKLFDTQAEAAAYTGQSASGVSWWPMDIDGVTKYQARKTFTKYYAIVKRMTLYMASAQSNSEQGLFIQCDKVYPDIIINGPAKNISLINDTTDRKIELDVSVVLDVNEQIKITTTPLKRKITKTAKNKAVTNLIPWLSADSTLDWWLRHGENKVTFNNSETTPESFLKFSYTERWGSLQ